MMEITSMLASVGPTGSLGLRPVPIERSRGRISLLYAAIFYPATVLWVLVGGPASLFGRGPTLAIVLSWVDFHHRLARHVLGIRLRIEGDIPRGPLLIAVKHQSMFETLEMVRLANLPIIVMKKELADIPLFGLLTRRYGVIPVERSAGAKALRDLLKRASRRSRPGGRSSSIPKARGFALARRRR